MNKLYKSCETSLCSPAHNEAPTLQTPRIPIDRERPSIPVKPTCGGVRSYSFTKIDLLWAVTTGWWESCGWWRWLSLCNMQSFKVIVVGNRNTLRSTEWRVQSIRKGKKKKNKNKNNNQGQYLQWLDRRGVFRRACRGAEAPSLASSWPFRRWGGCTVEHNNNNNTFDWVVSDCNSNKLQDMPLCNM